MADDQLIELEAIESIYVQELTIFDRTYPNIRFSIVVKPSTGDENAFQMPCTSDDGGDSDGDSDLEGDRKQELKCVINFTLPDGYPESAVPAYTLTGLDESDTPMCSANRLESIRYKVDETAQENLGMPAVFCMVTTLQEELTTLQSELAAAEKFESERAHREQEEQDKKKMEGTPVTVENFAAWRQRCGDQIRSLREQYVKARDQIAPGRLTGREQFLQDATLALSDVAFVNADSVPGGGQGQGVEIDESLFEDFDDDDDDPDYVPSD